MVWGQKSNMSTSLLIQRYKPVLYKILQWVLVKTVNDSLNSCSQIKNLGVIESEVFSVSIYSLIKQVWKGMFNVDKKCQGTGGNVKEGNLIGGF